MVGQVLIEMVLIGVLQLMKLELVRGSLGAGRCTGVRGILVTRVVLKLMGICESAYLNVYRRGCRR